MWEGFPTGSTKMPARIPLGALWHHTHKSLGVWIKSRHTFLRMVNSIEDCWRKDNIPTTAVQNMCMLHHGFWMWKNRRAYSLPSPWLLGSSALKFLCSLKTHSHHPTSPAAKQPPPWRRVAASLLKGSKWTLTQIPSCLAVNLQAFRWLRFTGYFIHPLSVSPTPKQHLFLFQYCRCLAGTLSKC